MNSGQKVLKVLAIILAIFIIICICSAFLFGITIFSKIIYQSNHKNNTYLEDRYIGETIEENIEKIESLSENVKVKIDLEISSLKIKEGTTFQVERINEITDVSCRVNGNTLEIKEKDSSWFDSTKENSTIIVYIPEGMILDDLEISIDIGNADVQGIQTKKLDIDAGAGTINLNSVVAQKVDVDGGAGNITINDSVLTNLDFDCGIGVTKISGDIKGNSKISCGVGKMELHLTQPQENYKIRTETALGEITLNGETCTNGVYGTGDDYIKVEGGIGSVEITTNS